MQRKTLLVSALALLIAGAASFTMAQDAASSTPTAPKAPPAGKAPPTMGPGNAVAPMDGPGFDDRDFRGPGRDGRQSPVIDDLHALEKLYLISGRSKELPALYNEVLAKSQDPRVRTYVYHHLARSQAMPANPDQAIATLRKSLEENLANEAKQRAEFEKMRSEREQRRSQAKPAATQP
jgi:hypothetical protein